MGRILSKTSFLRGKQCEKSLWLYYHQPSLRDKPDDLRRSLFGRGHKVGLFARGLFPGGVDSSASSPSRWAEAVEKTRHFILSGKEIIYEAAFEHEGCLVFADIIVRSAHGWDIYEVKSSLRVSDYHLQDAAFQFFVISGAGLSISSFQIVHPHPDFVHQGEITPEQFFLKHDVSARIKSIQHTIGSEITSFKMKLGHSEMPVRTVGPHCQSPFPCDFKTYCWGKLHPRHILNLPAFSSQDSSRIFNYGVRDISEIPPTEPLNPFHSGVIRSIIEGRAMLNRKELERWLGKISYPLAFFDLEMFMPAIPMFKGCRPFEHLPFAYSLRRIEREGSEDTSLFFMADAGTDPRESLCQNLIHDLKDIKTLVVFDATQEHAVLRKLGAIFPARKDFMEELCRRTLDLAELFVGRKVYFPLMGNSFSLKSLSGVAGIDMEQMRISNGYDASAAFELLNEPDHLFRELELKNDLKRYSMADTEIMLRVFHRLGDLVHSDDVISIP